MSEHYIPKNDMPLPEKHKLRKKKYPHLEIGEYFTVPINERQSLSPWIARNTKKHGHKYTTRKLDENTVGVWRIV